MAVSSEYRVNIVISSKDQTSQSATKAGKSLSGLATAAKLVAVAYAAVKAAQKGMEFVKLGADVQRTTNSFNMLAEGAGHSGEAIVRAIQTASDFTIDKMTAMSSANKAMLLGVAESPSEFANLAKYATLLGRAMGQDAAKSIDDFVVAAGRQSKMIADNLGLMVSATDAQARYAAEHGKTADQLSDTEKKQAFLNEMLRQAKEKTADLEGANSGLSSGLAEVKAALTDTKNELAVMAAETFETAVDTHALAEAIREIPVALKEAQDRQAEFSATLGEAEAYLSGDVNAIDRYTTAQRKADQATWDVNQQVQDYNGYVGEGTSTLDMYSQAVDSVSYVSHGMMVANRATMESQGQLEEKILETIKAIEDEEKAVAAYNAALPGFLLDAGMRWTTYFGDVAAQTEEFAKTREQLELEHQEKLAELQKAGQSHAIVLDETAEQAKLDLLRERLEIALQSQAEFTGKTHESTRMAKDLQIRQLQEQIAAQEGLLDDYHNGRLVQAGKNVDALIVEEGRRHQEAIAGLEEEIAKTQELQRQQLGTLMLQTFETWAEMKDIPADKMLEMRTAIAEEYGLISAEEAQLVDISVRTWETWAEDFSESADQVVRDLDTNIQKVRDLQAALGELPDEKLIDITLRYHGAGGVPAETATAPWSAGEMTPTTTNNNYTLNQTVNTQATTQNVVNDFETARSLVQ